MAKKVKKTTKSTSSKKHSLADDHSFLIVVGGGFIVILLMLITLSRSSVMSRINANDDRSTVAKEVADENTVTISGDSLTPEILTVPVGTQVTWINADEEEHMVTSYNGAFDSKELEMGEKSSYMFTTVGTYTYTVDDMSGSVVVE